MFNMELFQFFQTFPLRIINKDGFYFVSPQKEHMNE